MKKVLITGSSSGIGLGIAEYLLKQGCTVIGLARCHDKIKLKQTLNAGDHFKNYIAYAVDFSAILNLENALKLIKKQHHDIEAIICAAGFGQFSELEQFSALQIYNLMNVNFTSQAIVVKNFLPLLKCQQRGKIIFIGSEAALKGNKKGSIYCASKFALRGFCQSLRQECQKVNVAVTLINPGLVRTPFFAKLDFAPGNEQNNALEISDIVETIAWILKTPAHCVAEEINLQPLHSKVVHKVRDGLQPSVVK